MMVGPPVRPLSWLAVGALGVAVAGMRLVGLFSGPTFVVPVVVAVVLPPVLSWWTWRRRQPPSSAAVISAVGLALALALFGSGGTGWWTAPSPGSVVEALAGAGEGWRELLSSGLPAPAEPSIVGFLVVAVWLASGATAELSLRGGHAFIPGLPAVLLLVLANLVAADGQRGLGSAVLFTVVLLVGMFVRGQRGRRGLHAGATAATTPAAIAGSGAGGPGGAATRLGLTAAAIVVLVVAGAALVGPRLVRGDQATPYDPRARWTPPIDVTTVLHPLDGLADARRSPERPMFDMTTDGVLPAAAGGGQLLVRVVALDHYDGVAWEAPGLFSRASRQLPASAGASDGTTATVRFDVAGLAGPWLPTVGVPRAVDLADGSDRLNFDAATGNLALGRPTVDGAGYALRASFPDTSPEALADAQVDAGSSAEDLGVPAEVSDVVRSLVEPLDRRASPYVQAQALVSRMDSLVYNPDLAPPGHSLGNLGRFAAGETAGSAEQFATLFALGARDLNLPSRVVVGYRIPVDGGGTSFTALSTELHAWPEIHFAGLGWAPFEPTPLLPEQLPPAEMAAPTTSVVEREPAAEQATADEAPPEAPPPTPPPHASGPPAFLWLVLGFLALVTLYLGVLFGSRRWVRARRHRGPAEQQILGAWAQARDVLATDDAAVPPALTPAEVLDRLTTNRVPARGAGAPSAASDDAALADLEPLARLAPLVSVATYDTRGATGEQAAEAWAAVDDLARRVRRHRSPVGRLSAALLPRWRPRPRRSELVGAPGSGGTGSDGTGSDGTGSGGAGSGRAGSEGAGSDGTGAGGNEADRPGGGANAVTVGQR